MKPKRKQPKNMFTRRAFFRQAARITVAFLVMFRLFFEKTQDAGAREAPSRLVLKLQKVTRYERPITQEMLARVFILRKQSEKKTLLCAMSSLCTHQTCIVGFQTKTDLFECPCHGSRFTSKGEVLNGPAKEPLPFFKLSVSENGYLQVHIEEKVDSSWRLALE